MRIGLFIIRIQAQQLQAMLIRCPMGGESGNATLVANAVILTKLDESFDSN